MDEKISTLNREKKIVVCKNKIYSGGMGRISENEIKLLFCWKIVIIIQHKNASVFAKINLTFIIFT